MSLHRTKILSDNEILTSYRLVLLANYFVGPIYADISQRYGIARGEFVVIFCLQQLGPLTAQDVCDITRHPKNSVSQALSKLVEQGYVKKKSDPEDGRRSFLHLTAKARQLYAKVMPIFLEREQSMLSPLTSAERVQFLRILGKLVLRDDDWIQGEDRANR
jgi:DNA-binding MarR family transcriptional regulator